MILCADSLRDDAPPSGHGMMTQKGTSRNSCLVPYSLQPFEALTPEGTVWNAGSVDLVCVKDTAL